MSAGELMPQEYLQGLWHLNGNSNNSGLVGGSGTDTDVTYVSGRFGQCGSFNGSTSKVVITDNAGFKPTGNFTIGGWFNTSASGYIFQSFSQNTNIAGIWVLVTAGNVVSFRSGKNTGTVLDTDYKVVTGTTTVTNSNWHLFVGSWDGSFLRLYVDGIQEGGDVSWANAPAYAATNYVRIGCANSSGTDSNFFNGRLDEIFLLNGTAWIQRRVSNYYSWAKGRMANIL